MQQGRDHHLTLRFQYRSATVGFRRRARRGACARYGSATVSERNPSSLEAAPPPLLATRRSERRLFTLFRTGKLRIAAGQTICRLRNISPHGFMADVCPAPPPGTLVSLELCEGLRSEAEVVWSEAGRFGAEFLQPQDLVDLLGRPLGNPNHRHRALRITPDGGIATVFRGAHSVDASILNISQTGIAIFAYDLALPQSSDRAMRVEIDGLDPMPGLLCWASSGAAGIQFDRPLSFEALSHWLWATSLAGRAAEPRH